MRRIAVLSAFTLLVAVGCASDDAAQGDGTPEPTSPGSTCTDTTQLRQVDNRFEPACLAVQTGDGLTIDNAGESLHNFSVEGFAGLDVDVRAGEQNNTESLGLDAGTYRFFCKYHADIGMEGELRVTERSSP